MTTAVTHSRLITVMDSSSNGSCLSDVSYHVTIFVSYLFISHLAMMFVAFFKYTAIVYDVSYKYQ